MFNVTVHSSSGLDVALDMPVHYVRHSRDASASSSMPGKQLRKRLIYGPITTGCSEPYTEFQESLCVIRGPGTSAQTFRVKCTLPEGHPTNQGQVVLIRGTCTRNEIFVTKTVQGHAQANCVSQVNFKFIQVAKTGGFNPAYHANHMLSLPQRDQIDHTGLVATLVASNDFTQAVIADRILLQAVGAASKVDAVNGPSLYAHSHAWFMAEVVADDSAVTTSFVLAALATARPATPPGSVLYRQAPRR